MSIPSYPTIWTIGHSMIHNLFVGPVLIEEKVDGSQFSFMLTDDDELLMRSKGKDQSEAPDKMFLKAALVLEERKHLLTQGLIYRGEYLSTPRHNALQYNRTPTDHIVIFDIQEPNTIYNGYGFPGEQAGYRFMPWYAKQEEAARIGFETVPMLYAGEINASTIVETITGFVRDTESFLGGPKIEGVVVKNYAEYTSEKKVAIGKWVSEAFKEVHRQTWGDANPTRPDFIRGLGIELRTEARWRKTVQHLRDDGQLTDSPKDIGALLRELHADILQDSEAEIRDRLFKKYWPDIVRQAALGFPQWYKEQLLLQAQEAAESAAN